MKNLRFTFAEWVAEATRCAAEWDKPSVRENPSVVMYTDTSKEQAKWSGADSFEAAQQIMREGYVPKGGFNSEIAIAEQQTITAMLDVSGSVVDVGMFLTGEPECMWEFQTAPTTRFADIVINLANPALTEARDLFAYADKVYALVMRLKTQNIECNITGVLNTDMGDGYNIEVEIHRQGQVFSPATISAALHPSMLRRMFIGYLQGQDNYRHGCGRVGAMNGYEGSIVLPSVHEAGDVDCLEQTILNSLSILA